MYHFDEQTIVLIRSAARQHAALHVFRLVVTDDSARSPSTLLFYVCRAAAYTLLSSFGVKLAQRKCPSCTPRVVSPPHSAAPLVVIDGLSSTKCGLLSVELRKPTNFSLVPNVLGICIALSELSVSV